MHDTLRIGVLVLTLAASVRSLAQPPPASGEADPETRAPTENKPAEGTASSEASVPESLPTEPGDEAPSVEEDLSEEALVAELELLGAGVSPRGVFLSGFMDFNYRHVFRVDSFLRALERNDSFYVGNINLYVRANITARLRSLVEVRFTYAPNGARALEGGDYIRTLTPDYADYERSNKLGAIEIERAHGEYEFAQLLTVRVGQFLTPYGIWNVDHGSPTVIPVIVPYVIGQQLMPERQTGFELFGSHDLSDRLQLAYHLTLSNGRGPFDSHLDLDRNKAIGGRLRLASQASWGDLTVGTSAYYGRYTNRTAGSATEPAHVLNQRDELAFAGDVKWTLRGAHLQAELVHAQNAYKEGGRPALVPDRANWGTYVLAGYRIPRIELMPFVTYQRQDDEYLDLQAFAYGLNYRPLPELVLKAMVMHGRGDWGGIDAEFVQLDMQIAWAF